MEIGVGPKAERISALAGRRRMAKVSFIGVDKVNETPVWFTGRGNLRVVKADGIGFLTRAAAQSLDHIYSLFTIKHVPFHGRTKLFEQAIRALKPGRELLIVDDSWYRNQFARELTKAGFVVTSREMSPQETLKLGSPGAKIRGESTAIAARKLSLKPEIEGQKLAKAALTYALPLLKRDLAMVEGTKPDKATAKVIEAILRDHLGVDVSNPAVLIRAYKPVVKMGVKA